MSAGSMTTRATPKPPTVDLTNSATDAFLAFNEFHERLNFSLKSNVVSLLATEQDITAGTRSIADLKEASFLNKRLWGGMPAWGNAARALEGLSLAQHDAASAAIVRAFSAFDLFLETTDGELQCWQQFQSGSGSQSKSANVGDTDLELVDDSQDVKGRALRFYERKQWSTKSIAFLTPVYTYFRQLRNCIAHADATATPALVEASISEVWVGVALAWEKNTSDLTVPSPIHFTDGQVIRITHREAILASSMLRRIALDVAQRTLASLGIEGLVYVKASRAIRAKDRSLIGGRLPTTRIRDLLHRRNRVPKLDHAQFRETLEHLGLWKRWMKVSQQEGA